MPTDYQCEACNLAIQIGWFHFHNTDGGYWAATLGFCQKCGTIHMLEHPSEDALPERMVAQPGPLDIAESYIKGVDYRIPLREFMATKDLSSCAHCGAKELQFGTIDEAPVVAVCPRCHASAMKKLYSWMT